MNFVLFLFIVANGLYSDRAANSSIRHRRQRVYSHGHIKSNCQVPVKAIEATTSNNKKLFLIYLNKYSSTIILNLFLIVLFLLFIVLIIVIAYNMSIAPVIIEATAKHTSTVSTPYHVFIFFFIDFNSSFLLFFHFSLYLCTVWVILGKNQILFF